jgi:hypothetical protein
MPKPNNAIPMLEPSTPKPAGGQPSAPTPSSHEPKASPSGISVRNSRNQISMRDGVRRNSRSKAKIAFRKVRTASSRALR